MSLIFVFFLSVQISLPMSGSYDDYYRDDVNENALSLRHDLAQIQFVFFFCLYSPMTCESRSFLEIICKHVRIVRRRTHALSAHGFTYVLSLPTRRLKREQFARRTWISGPRARQSSFRCSSRTGFNTNTFYPITVPIVQAVSFERTFADQTICVYCAASVLARSDLTVTAAIHGRRESASAPPSKPFGFFDETSNPRVGFCWFLNQKNNT